jgi:hypothetical protein
MREEVTGWRMIDQGAEFTSEGLVLDVEGQAYAAHKEQSDTWALMRLHRYMCPAALHTTKAIIKLPSSTQDDFATRINDITCQTL